MISKVLRGETSENSEPFKMLYIFQMSLGREDLPDIVRFIAEHPEGIFVLPEGSIDLESEGIGAIIKEITALTDNGRLSVISGVSGESYTKAYLFAYGEKERVGHIHQQFTIPCGTKKVKTAIRVCSEISEHYMFNNFQLLAHPSSLDLNALMGLVPQDENYSGIHQRLGLEDTIIASASFSSPRVIDASGRPIGNRMSVGAQDGHQIYYMSHNI